MNLSRQRWWMVLLIWLVVGSALLSCNSPVQESTSQENTVAAVAETPKEAPVKEYSLERYGDAEIFSTPRLQFSWQAPGENRRSLWSIKLDGTDLRRVLPYDLLFKEGGNFNYTPLRSPDNRYIYITQNGAEWPQRNLIDLKNQTVSVLKAGGTVPHGTWSISSKSLYFYADLEFFRYSIDEKKLVKYKWIPSQGIRILPNGKFFALHDTGFSIHKPNGDKINDIKLGGNILPYFSLSSDGMLLMYHDSGDDSHIIELKNPKNKIYSDKFFKRSSSFSPDNRSIYYTKKRNIYKINVRENKREKIFSVNNSFVIDLSLVNYK